MLASLGGCVKHKTCAAGEWTKAQGDAKTDSKQSLSPRRPPVVGGPGCYKSADKTTIVRICAFLSNEIKTLLSFYEPDVTMHPKGTPAPASSVKAQVFEERVDLSNVQ